MAQLVKPLRSDDSQPRDIQFKHFGVLNDGSQSKSSMVTAVTTNVLIVLILFILGAAAKKTVARRKLTSITLAAAEPKPEPVKPKIIPKPLPTPPVVKMEPPKIKLPDVKLPDVPKPPEIKMAAPVPIVVPAPPKLVTAPAAPKVVSLAHPQAAAIANDSPHPSAVRLGQMDNPIKNASGPAVSNINLGRAGAPGMNASNTGLGAVPRKVNLGGNGSPNSSSMNGSGVHAVQGVKLGVAGGTGPMNATGRVAGPVNLGQNLAPAMPKPAAYTAAARGSGPKVVYKPKPQYTAEAIAKHIEGTVSVRLRVSSSGTVQVIGVTSDLGYGLGEAAVRAVQETRFQPAIDAEGRPVDWEGVVNVAFQLAG